MTLSSTKTKATYGGNGSTTTFAIPFMFMCDDDIEVVLTDTEGLESVQTISTDYQLSGAGDQSGGACTMSVPPEGGQILVVRRSPAMIQEVDYVENDAFPAATHEAALDKLTMICQALSERLDRTINFKVSSAVSGVEFPEPVAGRVLAWNTDENNLSNKDIAEAGAVMLPLSVAEGGTGASSKTLALSNLGFKTTGQAIAACEEPSEVLTTINAEPADADILKADETAEVSVGYTLPAALPAAANPPLVSGGRVQALTVSGTVNLAAMVERGIVILRLTGSGTLNFHADYMPLNGSETSYDCAGGILAILNDGSDLWYSLTNKAV